jgi:hypothetical protein
MKAVLYSFIFILWMNGVCDAQIITNNTIDSNQNILVCSTPNLLTGSLPTGGTGTYSYVWLQSTVSATTGFVAASGTNNTQNYQPSQLYASAWYERVVNSGSFTDTSVSVEMAVVTNLTTTPNPSGPIVLPPNGSVTLCVTPVLSNVFYGWDLSYPSYNTWSPISGATNSCLTVSYPGFGVFYCVVSSPNGGCAIVSNPVTIYYYTTTNAPIITPATTTYVCPGNTVTLSSPLVAGNTYQWLLNNNAIAGATNASYTTSTLGNYTVQVAGSNGYVLSDTVTVAPFTSVPPLTVTPSSATIYPCSSTTLFATVVAGLSYQWYLNGNPIANATDTSYTTVTAGSYKVVGSNGTCTDTSNAVTITLVSSVSITPSGSIVLPPNGSVTLCVTPVIPNLSYQWQRSTDGGNTWTNVAGGTNSCLTVTGPIGGYFSCEVYASNCLPSWTTNGVFVNYYTSINAPIISPAITTYVCPGNTVTLSTPLVAGNTYQWLLNNNAIAGATNASYTTSTLGNYTVQVAGSNGYVLSDTVTVAPFASVPPLTVTPSSATIYPCSSTTLFATVVAGLSYQWYLNGSPIAGATDTSYTTVTAGSYKVVGSNGTCTDTSNAVTATVQSFNYYLSVTGPTSICPGTTSTTTLCVNPSFPNALYQWEEGLCLIGPWVNIAGATNPCFTPSNTLPNYGYRCLVTFSQCGWTYSTNSFCFTTSPAASTISPSGTYYLCNGGSVTLTATVNPGYVYQWYLNGNPIAGATNTTYTTSTSGNYQMYVDAGTSQCMSLATTVIVASVPPLTVTPGNTIACLGGTQTLTVNAIPNMSYQWYLNGSAIAGATNTTYTTTTSGSYKVIGNNGTCSDTSNNATVTFQISIVANGPTALCPGSTTSLCLCATYPGAFYQWGTSVGSTWSPIAGATNPCLSPLLFSPGSYFCTITFPQTGMSYTTNTVTITTSPAASTISPSGTCYFCPGGSVTLTATVNPGYTYQWLLNGNIIAGATNTTYTTSTPGNYQMYVVAGTIQCMSAATTVTQQTINPTINITPSSSTICAGSSQTLTTNSNLGFSYQWYLNNSPIPGATGSAYNASSAGNYSVTATSGICSATSGVATLTVLPIPTAVITANGPTTFCQQSSVWLLYNAPPLSSSFQWMLGGIPINGAANFTYNATASGNYTLVVSNGACSSNSNAINVNVIPAPNVTIASISGQTSICAGDTVHLIASPSTGLTYQWSDIAGIIVGATNATYSRYTSGNFIAVYVTNSNNCSAYSNTIDVDVNPLPGTTISTVNGNTICQGTTANLYANTLFVSNYQWKKNNQIIPGATNYNLLTAQAGNYQVVATVSTNNCKDSSNIISINVLPVPTPSITQTGNLLSTGSYAAYQWFHGLSPIPGATQQQYLIPISGVYAVQVTDTNGCTGTANAVFTLGLDEINSKSSFVVYPNPNQTGIFFLPTSIENEAGSISIYNTMGQKIKQCTIAHSFSLQEQPKGVYFYKIYLVKTQQTIEGKLVYE